MIFTEFKKVVDDCRKNHSLWFNRPMDPQANDEQIRAAEQMLDIRFPHEYIDFVKEFGGGNFVFTRIFSVYPNSKWYLVPINIKWKYIENGFLAISDDGTGGSYGFPVKDGLCESRIAYWDHDENYGNGRLINTEYNDLFSYIMQVGLNM